MRWDIGRGASRGDRGGGLPGLLAGGGEDREQDSGEDRQYGDDGEDFGEREGDDGAARAWRGCLRG
jgi:hypothetical protein